MSITLLPENLNWEQCFFYSSKTKPLLALKAALDPTVYLIDPRAESVIFSFTLDNSVQDVADMLSNELASEGRDRFWPTSRIRTVHTMKYFCKSRLDHCGIVFEPSPNSNACSFDFRIEGFPPLPVDPNDRLRHFNTGAEEIATDLFGGGEFCLFLRPGPNNIGNVFRLYRKLSKYR